jgi:hypothetical protein
LRHRDLTANRRAHLGNSRFLIVCAVENRDTTRVHATGRRQGCWRRAEVDVRPAEGGFEFVVRLKDPSAIEGMKIRSGTRIHHEWTAVARLQLANTIED